MKRRTRGGGKGNNDSFKGGDFEGNTNSIQLQPIRIKFLNSTHNSGELYAFIEKMQYFLFWTPLLMNTEKDISISILRR